MDNNIKIINIRELEPGMILAKSILRNGKVLAYRNNPLKDSDIIRLIKEKIDDSVFIYENIVYSHKRPFTDNSLSNNVKILNKTYNELSLTLNNIFYKLKMFQDSTITELREFSNKIISKGNDTNSMLQSLILNGSSNDPIYRHSINVALLSNLLGKWLNLHEEKLNLLTFSALLHDIGKTKIDEKIINKKTPLNFNEREKIAKHSILGYNIVKDIQFLDKSVYQGVLLHHENEDGTGYPFKMTGDKITQFAKIIAIADSFDNFNSTRYGNIKINPFKSLELLKEASFSTLDYCYTDVFINNILNFFIGKDIILENGKKAQLLMINVNSLDKPLINIDGEFIDLTIDKDIDIKGFFLN